MQRRIEHLVTGDAGVLSEQAAREASPHLGWLMEGPVRDPDGMLRAWVDGKTPAHTYPESTGYLISLLCYLHRVSGQDRFAREASRAVEALVGHLAEAEGCGRDGTVYLFDTAVCLRALGTFHTLFEGRLDQPGLALMDRLAQTCERMFQRRQAFVGAASNGHTDRRWSRSFSAHLVKAAHLVSPWLGGWREVTDELVRRFHDRGRFYADEDHGRVYLHASCYAAEGLLAHRDRYAEELDRVAPFLARIQLEGGGIPAWWPDESSPVTDATAQAVRIWQCTGRTEHEDNIQRGLAFLERMALPGGGFRYSPEVAHANSWATIFAVQAMAWQRAGAEVEWIV